MPNVRRGTPKAPCEVCGQLTASRFGVCKRSQKCANEATRRRKAEHPELNVEMVRQWRARPGNYERTLETNRKSQLANPESRRRYRAENRERILESKRRYRAENRERVLESERRRRAAPERREQSRKYAREYAAKNAERQRENRRRYVAENRQRLIDSRRRARAENPERHREANRRYIQREDRPCASKSDECSSEFAVPYSVYCKTHKSADAAARHKRRRNRALRRHAEAQGWICTWCTLPLPEDLADMHLDHIIPKAALVIEDDWNFQALHERCNLEKCDKITEQAVALAAEHGIDLKSHPAWRWGARNRNAA